MKKVLIIDDDALVRMFLRQIIPWEDAGYRIIGDARDGEEGFKIFKEFHPDIVVTDVSMPVMNGIDFLKRIKEEGFQGGVIMLSCHEDFEYVKTAMALGADEYILKNHLNQEVLLEVLKTVEKHMDKRLHEINQQDELVTFAQKGIIEIRKEVLQKLLDNETCSIDEQKMLLETAYITGTFRQCAVVLARLPIAQRAKKDTFYELCQQISISNNAAMVVMRERVCVFLVDLTEFPSTIKQYEIFMTLQKVVHDYMWEYLGVKLTTGSSEVCSKEGALAKAVRQAENASMLGFYERGAWGYPDSKKMCNVCPKEAEKFAADLPYLINLGDEVMLEKSCENAVNAMKEEKVLPQIVCDWIRRCDMAGEIIRPEKEYAWLESIEQIEDYMNEYILLLYENRSSKTPDNVSLSIKNAANYIKEHFNDGCSLNEVAEHVSLTPTYLSARFKKEMGICFVEYLTEVRIKQAQWLLKQNRHESVRGIAELSGFTDYQHFCKVFKKKVGCSPAVFRKAI